MVYITIPFIEVCDHGFQFEYRITNSENIVKIPVLLVESHNKRNAWVRVGLCTNEMYSIGNDHA